MCVVQQWPDALFLSKWSATFDFLNVLWDPSTGVHAFCRSNRSRRPSVGAHFTAGSPLSDAWFRSPDATWGRVAPDTDRGSHPGARPAVTTYSRRQRAREPRRPSSPRSSGSPRCHDHTSLCFRGLCQLKSYLERKWAKWGTPCGSETHNHSAGLQKPSVEGSEQRDLFKPNHLWIRYPLGYLDLNIKIGMVQLFEKSKFFFFFNFFLWQH